MNRPSFASLILLLALPLSACGSGQSSDGDGAGAGGAGGAGNPGAGSTGTGTSLDLGPMAASWQKAFKADAVGVTCEMSYDEMVASGAPSLTFGDTTIFVGFQQYGDNQDPVFFRFDAHEKTYCEHHEQEPPDGRAYGLTWDGGPQAYVVYTVVGGGTAFEQAAQGGWIERYGDGGGSAKVTVIAQVEIQFGTVTKATFVPAKVIKSGLPKTNTLVPADAVTVLEGGELAFAANSAWSPLNPDGSLMCATPDVYPGALEGKDGPNFLAHFTGDLSTMSCGSTADCSNVLSPCD